MAADIFQKLTGHGSVGSGVDTVENDETLKPPVSIHIFPIASSKPYAFVATEHVAHVV